VGKISQDKAPQSLSYFHEALDWQTWQTGFLFVFREQFDSAKLIGSVNTSAFYGAYVCSSRSSSIGVEKSLELYKRTQS